MNGFFVGGWEHAMPDNRRDSNGRLDIIIRLCFGPLETDIYGIDYKGIFFHEYKYLEGLQEGDVDYTIISDLLFFKELDYEIILSKKNNDDKRKDALQRIKEKLIM